MVLPDENTAEVRMLIRATASARVAGWLIWLPLPPLLALLLPLLVTLSHTARAWMAAVALTALGVATVSFAVLARRRQGSSSEGARGSQVLHDLTEGLDRYRHPV